MGNTRKYKGPGNRKSRKKSNLLRHQLLQRQLQKKEAQAAAQDGQAASTSALAQDNNEVPKSEQGGWSGGGAKASTSSQDPSNVCDLQMTVEEEVDEKKPRIKKPKLPKHLRDNQVLPDRPQRITKIHAEQLIKDIATNKPQYRAPPLPPPPPPPPPPPLVRQYPPAFFDVQKQVKPRIKRPRPFYSPLNCSECCKRLKERMFRCVQCHHVLLCGVCERRTHPDHCVLRLPSRGIYEKVKDLFESLKKEFDEILPKEDDEDIDDDGLMANVEEPEIEYDPMESNSLRVELIPMKKKKEINPSVSANIIHEYPVLSLPDTDTDIQLTKTTLASGLQILQHPPTLQYLPSLPQKNQPYTSTLVQNTQQFIPTLAQSTNSQPIAQGPLRTLQIMPMSFQITPLDPLAPQPFDEKPIINLEGNDTERMGGGNDDTNLAVNLVIDDPGIKKEPEEYVVMEEMPGVKDEPPDTLSGIDAGDGSTRMETTE